MARATGAVARAQGRERLAAALQGAVPALCLPLLACGQGHGRAGGRCQRGSAFQYFYRVVAHVVLGHLVAQHVLGDDTLFHALLE